MDGRAMSEPEKESSDSPRTDSNDQAPQPTRADHILDLEGLVAKLDRNHAELFESWPPDPPVYVYFCDNIEVIKECIDDVQEALKHCRALGDSEHSEALDKALNGLHHELRMARQATMAALLSLDSKGRDAQFEEQSRLRMDAIESLPQLAASCRRLARHLRGI